jgi:hypothetical protein
MTTGVSFGLLEHLEQFSGGFDHFRAVWFDTLKFFWEPKLHLLDGGPIECRLEVFHVLFCLDWVALVGCFWAGFSK